MLKKLSPLIFIFIINVHVNAAEYADSVFYETRGIQWNRLVFHTGTFITGGITMLGVLELLPEDATGWNMKEINKTNMFKRYKENFKQGTIWDKDGAIFNYVLHPYAGAVYYMAARGSGCNQWQSLLYSSFVSTVLWEYGIECFNEVPSTQDLIITPVAGSLIGEGFYIAKKSVVKRNYKIAGHKWIGKTVCWIVDPFNEFGNLFLKRKDSITTTFSGNKICLTYKF